MVDRTSPGDRLWDTLWKAMPVMVFALIGWGVRTEVVNALQSDDIEENKAEVARIRDLEAQATRLEEKVENLKERTKDLRETMDGR